jgi:hypothetical protein
VSLLALIKVLVPATNLTSPVTLRLEDSVIVPSNDKLSQVIPLVFKVVLAKQLNLEPVVITVPAVYVKVPVLKNTYSPNVIVPVVLMVVLFLIALAVVNPVFCPVHVPVPFSSRVVVPLIVPVPEVVIPPLIITWNPVIVWETPLLVDLNVSSTVMLLISVNAAVFNISSVPVCVNLPVLTKVVVPVIVVVPETFNADDRV